jgi:hypothetical protein
VHEYRHVQQFSNFQQGPAKFAWILLGEQGQGLLNAMTVPDWFFEGDAVFQETSVTEQGRGRLPDFFNGYRSLWKEGKSYSYQKLRNGSYIDYVPNHYQLGFMLVAHGREAYGPEFWKNVTRDAVRLKPFFYPLQGAVRRHSGVSYKQFVQDAFDRFRDDSLRNESRTPDMITAMNKRNVRDYLYPAVVGQDSILALKDAYREIPHWVILHQGRETRLKVRDITVDPYHTFRNGQLVYTAWKPQLRWAWQDFSDIYMMDLQSGKTRRLTTRSRYFSPDLSPDNQRISAVHIRQDGRSRIHLLDAHTGRLLQELPGHEGYFHTYPVFTQDGQGIVTAVRNALGQMALLLLDPANGTEKILVPFSDRPIAFPRVRGDYVLFTASYNRKDVVWAYHLPSEKLLEIGSHYTGSYMPELDTARGEVIYSSFTTGGMMLSRTSLSGAREVRIADWPSRSAEMYAESALDQDAPARIYERVAISPDPGTNSAGPSPAAHLSGLHPANTIASSAVPSQVFPSSAYRSGTRLFNFHSWRPWYEQPDWSLTAYSENVLNTFRSELSYTYNENEGYHKLGFSGIYGAWYPWITGGVSYTFDRFVADGPLGSDLTRTFNWNEFNANLGLRLPFNLSGGRHYRFLNISGTFNTQQLYFKQTAAGKPDDQDYRYLQFNLGWTMQVQQAKQHIFPRFAHAINMQYRGGIGNLDARQFLASASLFLPGVHRNHNLVLAGSYQARDTLGQYFFTNNFALSRGYPGLDFPRMGRVSGNYHFPLWYPDFGVGNVLYFLRLRANLWYDASWLTNLRTSSTTLLQSTGVEVYFDTRLWNQQFISIGVRYSRLLDADAFAQPPSLNQWQIILPLNLLPN